MTMIEILSAFGLSAASGLNAYLPILIVGLLGRFTDWVTLKAPWDTLENPWVLLVVAILLVIEMVVDKIPAVDTLNDIIQTFIRPAAGAILFAAGSNVISAMSPVFAMICGLLVAGGVHAAKATARPMITAGSAGMGNPLVSVVEDVVSGVAAFVAIVLPVLAAIFIVTLLGLYLWWRVRRHRRRAVAS
jgi:preprotein translocase subunit SecG